MVQVSPFPSQEEFRIIHVFFYRIYKIPDGKPENIFAFSGEAKNKKYAMEIIHECHEAWRRLAVTGESPAKTSKYDLSMYAITFILIVITSLIYQMQPQCYSP